MAAASGPRAVELVGVAASGKTTLFRALVERSSRFGTVPFGGAAHLGAGLANARWLVPAWLRSGGRPPTEKELRSLNYVVGWAAGVERLEVGAPVALFDHGPLFRLARLRAFGPPLVESPAFRLWADAAVRRWARLLGAVFWLDAPDELLVARIEARAERHRMQGEAAADTRRFLVRYRAAYEQLLAELAAAGGPVAERIDTRATPPGEIAERVLVRLGLAAEARRHAGGGRTT